MRPRFPKAQRAVSRRTHAALTGTQDRLTLRIMLGNGGLVTFEGETARVSMPTGGGRTFPAALVRAIQQEES